jgi:hypothetical protein
MANAGVPASAPPRKSAAIAKAKAFGDNVRIGAPSGNEDAAPSSTDFVDSRRGVRWRATIDVVHDARFDAEEP